MFGQEKTERAREFHDQTLPHDSRKVAHFCSMKITQDVRAYAQANPVEHVEDALAEGMREKSKEFLKEGAEMLLGGVDGPSVGCARGSS